MTSGKDFTDLQNEISGLSTGRIVRFFNSVCGVNELERKNRDKTAIHEYLNEFERLMADAGYKALYHDVEDLLTRAETLTQANLTDVENALAESRSRAALLPGGEMVFRDKNGKARTENGDPVDPVIAAGIIWPEDALSFEEHTELIQQASDFRAYQVDVMGQARHEMENREQPPSKERLEDIREKILDHPGTLLREELNLVVPNKIATEDYTAQPLKPPL